MIRMMLTMTIKMLLIMTTMMIESEQRFELCMKALVLIAAEAECHDDQSAGINNVSEVNGHDNYIKKVSDAVGVQLG